MSSPLDYDSIHRKPFWPKPIDTMDTEKRHAHFQTCFGCSNVSNVTYLANHVASQRCTRDYRR